MSYTTPQTWSVGESPTAAKLNANIRDNIAYLHDSIPTCSLFSSSPQTISNATWTAIAFATEYFDNDTMHDSVTNNTRITITTAGRYIVMGSVAYDAMAAGKEIGVRFLSNGVTVLGEVIQGGVNRNGTGLNTFFLGDFSASEYLELQTIQETGGNINTYIAGAGVTFSATRLT